jgi:hypothetical protein
MTVIPKNTVSLDTLEETFEQVGLHSVIPLPFDRYLCIEYEASWKRHSAKLLAGLSGHS